MDPPDGFRTLSLDGTVVWVRPETVGWVELALERAGTLHQAAARTPDARAMEGRGTTWSIPSPDDEPGWAVRHYRRGGRMAALLGDRYLRRGLPRPFQELRTSEEVRARGLPTPRVVAASVYPAGPFYRGDLVTELVPDALELGEILFDPERTGVSAAGDRKEALRETGRLVRKMAEAGVFHPDVNVRNVLLQWYGAPDGWVLDLDKCRVRRGRDRAGAARMGRRLLRSVRKWERITGTRLPESEKQVFRDSLEGRI